MAQYVNNYMKKCNRRALALFQIWVHRLLYETWRYHDIRQQRFNCSMCDMIIIKKYREASLKTIYCFMIINVQYTTISDLNYGNNTSELDPSFSDLTSADKFNVIMSDNKLDHYYWVAKFANQILPLRQSIVFTCSKYIFFDFTVFYFIAING